MVKLKHKVTGVVVEVSEEAAEKLKTIDYEVAAEPRASKPRVEK